MTHYAVSLVSNRLVALFVEFVIGANVFIEIPTMNAIRIPAPVAYFRAVTKFTEPRDRT